MLIKKYIKNAVIFMMIGMNPFQVPWQTEQVIPQPPVNAKAKEVGTEEASLVKQLNDILDDERLQGAMTSIHVQKAATGEEVFSQNKQMRLTPASNMKILTAVAALETLGENYRFVTEVLTDGKVKEKTIEGNVYLKGKGDPTLVQADIEQFAADLSKQGIEKITGDLIADDQWYDAVRLSRDLNWSDEVDYYGAQVSALTISSDEDYRTGTITVEVQAGEKIGEQATIQLTPETDYVTIHNKTETTAANGQQSISIDRDHGTNTIQIEGNIPLEGMSQQKFVTVWEPTEFVLHQFDQALRAHGIEILGKVKTGGTPKKASLVTSKESMPLKDVIIPFMKYSNNGHGEMLTKEMGRVIHDDGSWDSGLQVIRQAVATLGMNRSTIHLRDGSGMSYQTLIPAAEITALLNHIQDKDWFKSFEKSLPVAGEAEKEVGGSLRFRMHTGLAKGNALAKTGSLTGVSSLSGYVTSKDGEKLIFSILINNYLGASVNDIEDAIVTALAAYEFK